MSTPRERFYIGTSGWSYEDWKGIVYPERSHDYLAFISKFFNALEINVSFYRDVAPSMSDGWLRRIGHLADFQFTAKLHQRLTHQRNDHELGQGIRSALKGLEPLHGAGRLGALLAQFPWSFRDEPGARDWLRQTRDGCSGWPLVVELRHDSWMRPESLEFLRSLDVGFCNIDQPAHAHCIPPTELVMSRVAYVRLHGRNHARWFDHDEASQRYDYLYTADEIDTWVARIRRIAAQAQSTFVFTNNHFRGQAVTNALELKASLVSAPLDVPELLLDHYSELGKIARMHEHDHQRRLFS